MRLKKISSLNDIKYDSLFVDCFIVGSDVLFSKKHIRSYDIRYYTLPFINKE
jgi:hypothetical protein